MLALEKTSSLVAWRYGGSSERMHYEEDSRFVPSDRLVVASIALERA